MWVREDNNWKSADSGSVFARTYGVLLHTKEGQRYLIFFSWIQNQNPKVEEQHFTKRNYREERSGETKIVSCSLALYLLNKSLKIMSERNAKIIVIKTGFRFSDNTLLKMFTLYIHSIIILQLWVHIKQEKLPHVKWFLGKVPT